MKTPCIDWRGTLRTTLVLALLAQAGAALAAGFDLAALSAELARNKSGQARFTEERFVTGIDSPLRASGVLSFVAPDRFTRQTLEPLAESMTVEGNTITLKRGNRSRQMAMDAIQRLHPNCSVDELRIKFIDLAYGPHLAEQVRQWQQAQRQ